MVNSWDREPYGWRAWQQPLAARDVDPLVSVEEGNLFINNYHSSWPIDHDDGSNGWLDRGNFLLWGGSKQYLGFNKAQVDNVYVYADYTPALLALQRGIIAPEADPALAALASLSRDMEGGDGSVGGPEGRGSLGNGWGVCAMAYGTWSFPPEYRDTWQGNVCMCSSGAKFFDFNSCHPQTPADGNIPTLSGNTYASDDGVYALKCADATWTLAAAQAHGVDAASTLRGPYSVAEIVKMGHQVLGF